MKWCVPCRAGLVAVLATGCLGIFITLKHKGRVFQGYRGIALKGDYTVGSRHPIMVAVGMTAATMALSFPVPADSDLKTIGHYRSWHAATFTKDQERTCYAVSTPTATAPANVRRGKIHVMVSRSSRDQTDELMLMSGYPYKEGSTVRISIGASTFTLPTGSEFAWVADGSEIESLVKAMMAGQQMIIVGTSVRGTKTTDTFSLSGFTAAYKALVKACSG